MEFRPEFLLDLAAVERKYCFFIYCHEIVGFLCYKKKENTKPDFAILKRVLKEALY